MKAKYKYAITVLVENYSISLKHWTTFRNSGRGWFKKLIRKQLLLSLVFLCSTFSSWTLDKYLSFLSSENMKKYITLPAKVILLWWTNSYSHMPNIVKREEDIGTRGKHTKARVHSMGLKYVFEKGLKNTTYSNCQNTN